MYLILVINKKDELTKKMNSAGIHKGEKAKIW